MKGGNHLYILSYASRGRPGGCGWAGSPEGGAASAAQNKGNRRRDRLARQGNPAAYAFARPEVAGYDYSFSGLKTSFLYFLRDRIKENPSFIEENKADLAASLEHAVVDILMAKLRKAARDLGIRQVAVAGGVSANTGLRQAFLDHAARYGWEVFIPPFSFTTDNAAMIAIDGYYKFLDRRFCPISAPAYARIEPPKRK